MIIRANRRVARRRLFPRGPRLAVAVVAGMLAACGGEADPVALFENGEYEKAFVVFQQRAQSGDSDATNFLGVHYYLGAAVPRDFDRAAALFETAALAGHAGAQKNLGVMYLRGLGVKQNYHRAYGWLHHARAGGNEEAKKYMDLMIDNVTPNATKFAVSAVSEQMVAQTKLIGREN